MAHLGLEVVAAARKWAYARAKFRRLLDSKSAKSETVAAAKKTYLEASDKLEAVVARVETLAKAGALKRRKPSSRQFDWHGLAKAIAVGATALDDAINAPLKKPRPGVGDVIDAEFEVTKAGSTFVSFGSVETAPATGGVLANDTDSDGVLMNATLVGVPSNASAFTFNADGTFTYTPIAGFSGKHLL